MEPQALQTVPGEQTSDTQHRDLRRRNWPLVVIAAGVVLFFVYQAELVLVILMLSILLAFILDPVAELLQRLRLPRSLASFTAVLLLFAAMGLATYASYNQAASFVEDWPKYSSKVRKEISRVWQKAERWEKNADILPSKSSGDIWDAATRPSPNLTDLLTRGFGSVSEALLAASFIPFLVYFMLSWQQHVRSATVMLFRMDHRNTAYVTLGLIAKMMRSFMVGNLLVGVFMALISTIVFGFLQVPFFYFIGPISGFVSLVPYLGVLLAILPPLIVGVGQIHGSDMVMIAIAVIVLHLFSLNILYPKFLGNRLQLNPLAVTISLLFWGWLWGAMGLVLAIPLTGALKIVFDHVEPLRPYGAWIGE